MSKTKRGTPEWRESVARGSALGMKSWHAKRRLLAEMRPQHVNQWLRHGVVDHALRPVVDHYTGEVAQMQADLGGADECSAMEKALLAGFMRASVAMDLEFQRLLKNPEDGVPEKLITCISSIRTSLIALGLKRRARQVATPTLKDMGLLEKVQKPTQRVEPAIDDVIDVGPALSASQPADAARAAQGVEAPGPALEVELRGPNASDSAPTPCPNDAVGPEGELDHE